MPKKSGATFIEDFLAEYPELDYDLDAPPVSQKYLHLKEHVDHVPDSREQKTTKAVFDDAMNKQFASFYDVPVKRANDYVNSRSTKNKNSSVTVVEELFEGYPEFDYDVTEPGLQGLKGHLDCVPDSLEQKKVKPVLCTTMGKQFASFNAAGAARSVKRVVSLRSTKNKNSGATFIQGFFAEYPEFDYDATQPVSQEFRRLKEHFDWMPHSQEGKKAKSAYGTAMGKQFASFYGTSINDINAWKALCEALAVDPIPETIEECRDLIRSTHVNLVDFIDIRITGKPIKIFEKLDDLRIYTTSHDKYYPKESAKESGVLRYLLRKILAVD